MCRAFGCFLLLLLVTGHAWAEGEKPLLLRAPTVSQTEIVFSHAGDLWIVPREGGEPRRLTTHPAGDAVVGWANGGKSILFRSSRNSYSGFARLFTVPLEGGFPTEVPLPMATEGSYSPDGARLAYVPNIQWQRA